MNCWTFLFLFCLLGSATISESLLDYSDQKISSSEEAEEEQEDEEMAA